MGSVAYITHSSSLLHEMGMGHPECPERVAVIEHQLRIDGLLGQMKIYEAPEAKDKQLLRVHDKNYLTAVMATVPKQGYAAVDADTIMNSHTLNAARHAAGALIHAVDLVMAQECQRVFCNIRPPGHHAEHARAMGFCFFNNVAVGAAHALYQYGVERIAIIDFDVHHGNGTEDIFANQTNVLMVSTFQSPLYPGFGERPKGSNMVNIPLVPGSNGSVLQEVVKNDWLPALEKFAPELLFVSAGFDAHQADPLANLKWTEEDYLWVTQQIVECANRYCNGKVISTLEGGYALNVLGHSAAAHIQALLQ